MKHSLYCIDDHPIVSEGIRQLISGEADLECIGSAQTADQALEALKTLTPDLIIADISLKVGISGIELIKLIKERNPDQKCLMLSMHDEPQMAQRALKAGASGYLLKDDLSDMITQAIRIVLSGALYLSPSLAAQLMTPAGQPDGNHPHAVLSDRELEVLNLMGQGRGTREIADQLFISVKTVETYRQRLKEKLKLKTASELIRYAIEHRSS